MTPANPHSTAREDGSCDDCGSFHGRPMRCRPRELAEVYGCVGRTDGAYGGQPESAEVPTALATAIITSFQWHNWSGRAKLMIQRGPDRLEFNYGGLYAEGRTRADIYRELGIPPWETGNEPPSARA